MAIEIDPVCGMEVDTETSLLSYEHDGTTYWFCGKGCLLEFQDDPDKYLDRGLPARRCRRRPPARSQLVAAKRPIARLRGPRSRPGTPRRDRTIADSVRTGTRRRCPMTDVAHAGSPGTRPRSCCSPSRSASGSTRPEAGC